MDIKRARAIAEKFAANTCTAAEHDALFAWLADLPIAEINLLLEEYGGIFEKLKAVPENRDLWNKIAGRLDESHKESPVKDIAPALHRPRGRIRYLRTAAAAAVVVVLSAIWVLIPHRKRPELAIRHQTTKDVAPGGNRATLTLANGAVILLDSTRDGRLARQGNAEVVKLDNSRLVYQSQQGPIPDSATSFNTITTPKGGQYQVVLSDGSRVWLNSASTLRFPTVFRGGERNVELTGEGYFEIEKNTQAPFRVLVNHMEVRVLGTQFDIMAYGDEKTVNTTLLQGAVRIEHGQLSKQLSPGEQAQWDAEGNKMEVVTANVQKVIAWKNGIFEFENTDLPTIMRQLSRWYDIDVQYEVAPGKPELGGSISKHLNLSQVLNLLEKNGINHFAVEGRKVRILP